MFRRGSILLRNRPDKKLLKQIKAAQKKAQIASAEAQKTAASGEGEEGEAAEEEKKRDRGSELQQVEEAVAALLPRADFCIEQGLVRTH